VSQKKKKPLGLASQPLTKASLCWDHQCYQQNVGVRIVATKPIPTIWEWK